MSSLLATITERAQTLKTIAEELKTEFFGIDDQIDRILDSLRSWYIMPEIISYPLIINLWSMTGNGKTALVRSLVKKLNFDDRFCELQLTDKGISNNTSDKDNNLIAKIQKSGIRDGEPGIILFDEFQRYRTKNEQGLDKDGMEFQEIWMLLSDGKLPRENKNKDISLLEDVFLFDWENTEKDENGEYIKEPEYKENRKKGNQRFLQYSDYYLEKIESLVDYTVKKEDIKRMSVGDSLDMVKNYRNRVGNVHDFTKCLIINAGNLDEAFTIAESVDDCDTNADSFHEYTKKISVIEIKNALSTRFKPEQIARLGNNHVIYPSLSSDAYRKIIKRNCQKYLDDASLLSGVCLKMGESVINEIYDNAIFPSQGTRPVFSTIHSMFGSPLSEGILWAMTNNESQIFLDVDSKNSCLKFSGENGSHCVPISFEIRDRKNRYSEDYSTLISVHEMGHAILYSHLFGVAPSEIKINAASFNGGYNLYESKYDSRMDVLKRICVSYGGIVAEEIIFGSDLRSTGCASDIQKATANAAYFVRHYAMNGMESYHGIARTDVYANLKVSDEHIENILQEQKKRATDIVQKHKDFLVRASKDMLNKKVFTKEEFEEYAKNEFNFKKIKQNDDVRGNYAELLKGQ